MNIGFCLSPNYLFIAKVTRIRLTTMDQLDGKVVIVTGAGDGFGRILAVNLLDLGANVVLHGLSIEKLRVIS